jgi:hypothetical protein
MKKLSIYFLLFISPIANCNSSIDEDRGLKNGYNIILDILDQKIFYTSETVKRFQDPLSFVKESRREGYIEYWSAQRDFYIDCKNIIELKYPTETSARKNY